MSNIINISALREENELLQMHKDQEEPEHPHMENSKIQENQAAPLNRAGNGAHATSTKAISLPMTLIDKIRRRRARISKQPVLPESPEPPDLPELINNSPVYRQLESRLQTTSARLADLQTRFEQTTQSKLAVERQAVVLTRERDELAAKLAHMKSRVTGLEEDKAAAKSRQQNLIEQLAALQSEFENTRSEWEQVHKNLAGLLEAQQSEHEQVKAEWAQICNSLETEVADNAEQAQLSKVEKEQDATKLQCRELAEQLKTIQSDHEQARAEWKQVSKNQDEQLNCQHKEIEQHLEQLAAKNEQLECSRFELGIALRTQNMRENDLKELQSRYAEVMDIKNRQEDLLLRLQGRLSVAAECLQQLKSDDDVRLHSDAARALIKSLDDTSPDIS